MNMNIFTSIEANSRLIEQFFMRAFVEKMKSFKQKQNNIKNIYHFSSYQLTNFYHLFRTYRELRTKSKLKPFLKKNWIRI